MEVKRFGGETRRNSSKIVIIILILVILGLLIFISYIFVVKPSFNAYVVKKQIVAKDIVLNTLLLQLQQQGFVQINNGDNPIYLIQISKEDLQTLLLNQQMRQNQQAQQVQQNAEQTQ